MSVVRVVVSDRQRCCSSLRKPLPPRNVYMTTLSFNYLHYQECSGKRKHTSITSLLVDNVLIFHLIHHSLSPGKLETVTQYILFRIQYPVCRIFSLALRIRYVVLRILIFYSVCCTLFLSRTACVIFRYVCPVYLSLYSGTLCSFRCIQYRYDVST